MIGLRLLRTMLPEEVRVAENALSVYKVGDFTLHYLWIVVSGWCARE
jgi:hypothetical protein